MQILLLMAPDGEQFYRSFDRNTLFRLPRLKSPFIFAIGGEGCFCEEGTFSKSVPGPCLTLAMYNTQKIASYLDVLSIHNHS